MKIIHAFILAAVLASALSGCSRYYYYYPEDYANLYYYPTNPEYDYYNYTVANPYYYGYPYRFYLYNPPPDTHRYFSYRPD